MNTSNACYIMRAAKRIRFLDYKDIDDGPSSKASRELMISTFMRIDKLSAFFPLRKMHLHDPFFNTMLLPLTSPNLDSIVITKRTLPGLTEIGLASFLQSVAQSPLLRSLAIEGTFSNMTLKTLPDFMNLRRLIMRLENSDIPVYFLNRLASSMPSLQHLHIHIINCHFEPPNHGPQRPDQPHPIFRLSFPSLKTLYVGCDSILENLLGVLDAPLLKSATLALLQSAINVCMHEFVERNRQVLKDKVHKAVIKTVAPSLTLVESFEDLRDLIVSSLHGAVSMSDIVHTFTYDGSWSRSLVHLQLMQLNPKNPLDCMSIAALWFIADACPNLKLLEISIHRPDEPEKQLVMTKGGPHNLRKLVFLNLPGLWSDTTSLAIEFVSLLDHLFPSMVIPDYIGGMIDTPGAHARRGIWWKGVQDMWEMCQTIKDRNTLNFFL